MRIAFSLLLGIAISVVVSESTTATVSYNPHLSPLAIPQGRNSISGIVFGESRTPVVDTYVQLLDENGTTITQTRTNGSGRFAFYGLSNGRFKVKVFPVGTDYMEQIQEVLLSPVSAVTKPSSTLNARLLFTTTLQTHTCGSGLLRSELENWSRQRRRSSVRTS